MYNTAEKLYLRQPWHCKYPKNPLLYNTAIRDTFGTVKWLDNHFCIIRQQYVNYDTSGTVKYHQKAISVKFGIDAKP